VCGRFTLTSTPEDLARRFELDEPIELSPRYNVAPGQSVLAVRSEDGRRRAAPLRWGLVPGWAPDPSIGFRMINARIETLPERPAFREAFKKRRCLVPADGFYEWADLGGAKQPYHIALPESGPFGFAGLWECWRDPSGEVLESCTLVTAPAAPALVEIHGRMPVIVSPLSYEAWLDPGNASARDLLDRLVAEAPTEFSLHPVSDRVNRAQTDDAACLEPVPEAPRQESLF
jgi:putative SOS response-associated peptidase YedK